RGERVLPLAFGEAGVPGAPFLRDALAAASHLGGDGPVAGSGEVRAGAAGDWGGRGPPARAGGRGCGPGRHALGCGRTARLQGRGWVGEGGGGGGGGGRRVYAPPSPGRGGAPAPALRAGAVTAARREGRQLGAVIVTLPDNPTGTLAAPDTIRALCSVAEHHD